MHYLLIRFEYVAVLAGTDTIQEPKRSPAPCHSTGTRLNYNPGCCRRTQRKNNIKENEAKCCFMQTSFRTHAEGFCVLCSLK